MSFNNKFTKDNLDTYLKELAKVFRKLNGKSMPAEIILIGGAAILENYGFRDMTTDIDALIQASGSMKDAINIVGDKFGLPNGWINDDFKKTASYSNKIVQFSKYHKTYSGVLQIRVVSGEYLVAMKLRSARRYKNDLSDIVGILAEHDKQNNPLTLDMINKAVCDLYGGWEDFTEDSKQFIDNAIKDKNYAKAYDKIRSEEKHSKEVLIEFEEKYPSVTMESNVNDILDSLKNKSD